MSAEENNYLRKNVFEKSRKPRLRVERVKILTELYKETEGEPMIIRRAKALRKYAQEIPISIEDWQLIVGSPSADNFAVSPFPESTWNWIKEMDSFETREGDKYHVEETDKKYLKETLPWWKGKSIEDNVKSRLPKEVEDACDSGLISTGYIENGCGNYSLNYRKLLNEGVQGIIENINKKMEGLDLANYENYKKWIFYKAALIVCEALIDYSKRFSALAKELAEKEKNEERQKDLQIIAKNCDRVPTGPATNFIEALQSVWFLHCLVHFEAAGGGGIVLGRMDQYLYPFYVKYKEAKGLNEVKRWLKNFWANQSQVMLFLPKKTSMIWSGHPLSEQPTIGGLTEDGKDASNELTKLILEIEKELGLPRPDIAVMYHSKIDEEVLHKSCESLPKAMKPKIFNYDVSFQHLSAKGATEEDIRKGAVVIGCVSSGIEGKTWGNNNMAFVNLPKCLELALNNGVDILTNKQVGPTTGDPTTDFKTFEDLLNAFNAQLGHAIKMAAILSVIIEDVHKELDPQPLASIFIDSCLEKGLNAWDGGAQYNIPGIDGVGLANVADSLAAAKKLLFEEGQIKMAELLEALYNNWEEKEILRQKLINEASKFGNDEDYVDKIAVEVAKFYCEEVTKYKCPRGVSYYPGLYSVSAHLGLGEHVGATPDGRKAKTPLADGMSPAQGVLFQGPTAVLRSLTKIDHSIVPSGTLLNMKFNLSTLKKHEDKFINLIKTYMKLGGYHVQFNIIDTEILKDAQKHPEKYPDLVVRVAAYAAEFNSLPRQLQDDIIGRCELGIG